MVCVAVFKLLVHKPAVGTTSNAGQAALDLSCHGLTPAIECVNVVLPGCMWHAGQKRERHAGQNLDVAVAAASW